MFRKEKTMTQETVPFVRAEEAGKAIWFLGSLTTIKADGSQTGSAYELLEMIVAPGREPPPHIHHEQDEAFYILEGAMTIMCGDRTWTAAAGSLVFLPKGIKHTFKIEGSTPVKTLVITSPASPSGFAAFVQEMGEPASRRTLPSETPPDMEKLRALGKKYHNEILLPTPAQEGR